MQFCSADPVNGFDERLIFIAFREICDGEIPGIGSDRHEKFDVMNLIYIVSKFANVADVRYFSNQTSLLKNFASRGVKN